MLQTKFLQKIKTHILCSIFFLNIVPFLDNVEKYCRGGRTRMTIWRMRIACWVPRATNTNPGFVKLVDFPLQPWWHDRASLLHYKYTACVVNRNNIQCQKSVTTFPCTQCGVSRSSTEWSKSTSWKLSKTVSVRVTLHWGTFMQPLLLPKSHKHYTTCVCVCVCVCIISYRACSAHAPFCYPRDAPLYNNFPHYLINGTIFERKIFWTQNVFRFSLQICLKHFSL
jgi:hypothetical protein